MAWSTVNVYGLLERFVTRMIQQPYQFQQVNDGYSDYYPNVWIQAERNELANQIFQEIKEFNDWVGYNPLPIYDSEIVHLDNKLAYDKQKLRISKSAYLESFGQLGKEKLGTASVTYSGNTATVEYITSESTDEIVMYFQTSDGATSEGNELYRLYPKSTEYNTDRYIFTSHKSLFVIPDLQNELDSFVNGNPDERNELSTDNSNFVTDVDIFRVYNDTTLQAELLSVGDTIETTSVTPLIVDSRYSEFTIARNSSTSLGEMPYAVRVYYKAGYPLVNGNMFEPFETIILRRSKANLPESVKEVSYRISAQWQKDGKSFMNDDNAGMYTNPLGTRYIDYYTWKTYRTFYDSFYGKALYFP